MCLHGHRGRRRGCDALAEVIEWVEQEELSPQILVRGVVYERSELLARLGDACNVARMTEREDVFCELGGDKLEVEVQTRTVASGHPGAADERRRKDDQQVRRRRWGDRDLFEAGRARTHLPSWRRSDDMMQMRREAQAPGGYYMLPGVGVVGQPVVAAPGQHGVLS